MQTSSSLVHYIQDLVLADHTSLYEALLSILFVQYYYLLHDVFQYSNFGTVRCLSCGDSHYYHVLKSRGFSPIGCLVQIVSNLDHFEVDCKSPIIYNSTSFTSHSFFSVRPDLESPKIQSLLHKQFQGNNFTQTP